VCHANDNHDKSSFSIHTTWPLRYSTIASGNLKDHWEKLRPHVEQTTLDWSRNVGCGLSTSDHIMNPSITRVQET
jgi:hypothetical protein